MTTITTGPDGEALFDGMSIDSLADALEYKASLLLARHSDFKPPADIYKSAAAALRHLSAQNEWQPIETAPRDGTEILTVGLDSKRVIATKWLSPGPFVRGVIASYHQPDGWYWASWSEPVGAITPTHWRPLPSPPGGEK